MEKDMDFYTAIAGYYDQIFPLNKQALDFILARIKSGSSLLDVGCASGELSLALAAEGCRVTGIDFDTSMIDLARQKSARHIGSQPLFRPMDMREIAEHFGPCSFSMVLCLGNTLVHLNRGEDIQKALSAAHSVLEPAGQYVLQILNYDYILDKKIDKLPLIENNVLKFERYYRINGEQLDFETILTLKQSGRTLSNSIKLYPIRKEKLTGYLNEAGFTNIEYFGSFKAAPLLPDSLPLILAASR